MKNEEMVSGVLNALEREIETIEDFVARYIEVRGKGGTKITLTREEFANMIKNVAFNAVVSYDKDGKCMFRDMEVGL